MADKNRKTKKRKWTPVVLNDPTFFSGDMEGFVSLEVMEEYNLEELKEINVDVPPRKKKAKVQAEQVNLVVGLLWWYHKIITVINLFILVFCCNCRGIFLFSKLYFRGEEMILRWEWWSWDMKVIG